MRVSGGSTPNTSMTLSITAEDLKALKAAGMSDDILKALIIYSSRDSSDIERERAEGLLKGMGVVIVP